MTTILVAAAQILTVPIFVCFTGANPEMGGHPHRTFACEAHGCIWKNETFLKALDSEDRSALVIAGYWLDCEVTVAALYALADCYDVYIPVDASPRQSGAAARLAEARLLHAGATPLMTKQLLHEWIIEASSPEQRAALVPLVK